ncbi:ribonucleoside diphosphate reductase small subuni t [Vibrio phage D51]
MTQFNANNKGYQNGHYPLLLGEQMGLADSVNVSYPRIEALYQRQLSQIWNEFEVDITQDRMDMVNLPYSIVRPVQQNIMWQALADAVAARSISSLLMKWVSNPEFEHLINLWSFFETIHNRTYAHIIKQTFEDPSDMMRETYENREVLMRSEAIVRAFDALEALKDEDSYKDKQIAILNGFVALFALESIAFMASFSVTFGVAELGVFQGISQLVTLICRDEVLHTHMGLEVMDTLRNKEGWGPIFELCREQHLEMLNEIVQQELDFATHIFKDGAIPGMSEQLLQQEVCFLAYPTYQFFGMGEEFPFEKVESEPLTYMSKYIDSSSIQVAAQELQLTAYQVGIIKDDTTGLEIDFSDDSLGLSLA